MATIPPPESDPQPTDAPAGDTLDASLLALRQRLRAARTERGACPPWATLRDDLLPGGGGRVGRAERLAHRDLCPYCDAHVREWQRSIEHSADTLGALEKGVARSVVAGARQLARFSRGVGSGADPATGAAGEPATRHEGPAPAPAPVAGNRPVARPAPLRLLVVEAAGEHRIPEHVFLCAAVLEAEVACVARIEELAGDPDLDAVCGVIFAAGRPAAEWPEIVRRARDLAPGRPIVIFAPPRAASPPRSSGRLEATVLSDDDPAESLLMALDAGLR